MRISRMLFVVPFAVVVATFAAEPAPAPPVSGDWPQWGGSSLRNNTPQARNIPKIWNAGELDWQTGLWKGDEAEGIKWVAKLGSNAYGSPVIAGGKVFVATNNAGGRLKRLPAEIDLGCMLCFAESDGKFLWQYSAPKLASGRAHDWPDQGICCAALVEGDRMWFVSNRGEVVCLDTQGFRDGTNDGPVTDEKHTAVDEADVVWVFDMMGELGVRQHNMAACSVTAMGDLLFVVTSNGVDEDEHEVVPAPEAPSFLALEKKTGKVVWADASPGKNILHGQWGSPACGVLGGVPQAIFPGGDGWLYSFLAERTADGRAQLLWKFDCNSKESKWIHGGRGDRNSILATPVIHQGRVYIATGTDPEYGEGEGDLWCIDPTRRGDVSPHLAVDADGKPLPMRRIQAVDPEQGEVARDNPNSALLWHFDRHDANGDGKFRFEETLHRTMGTVAVKDGLLFLADGSGLFLCLDAATGKPLWNYDMMSGCWSSPLVVDGKVFIVDTDGDVTIFRLSREMEILAEELNMGTTIYTSPVVANGVLYFSATTYLYAIGSESK